MPRSAGRHQLTQTTRTDVVRRPHSVNFLPPSNMRRMFKSTSRRPKVRPTTKVKENVTASDASAIAAETPEASSALTRTGYNALRIVLQCLSSASDNLPLPGLKVALDILLWTITSIHVRNPPTLVSVSESTFRPAQRVLLVLGSLQTGCGPLYRSFRRCQRMGKLQLRILSGFSRMSRSEHCPAIATSPQLISPL
jgi:hypothetical protein